MLKKLLCPLFTSATLLASPALAADWLEDWQKSGDISAEFRYFFESAERSNVAQSNLSISAEPEFYRPLADGRSSVTFTPYFRVDENDDERSHGDIRELKWHKVAESWEFTAGINSLFWGVTETIHLVNIINQLDFIENPDGEDVLGQPMLDLTLIRDWGTVDIYVLPYFRERSFAGPDGRPSSTALISSDRAVYESSAEEWHTDWALRWAKTWSVWDIGLSYFNGTARDPRFESNTFELNSAGEVELIPIYEIIEQFGLDLQGTFESWLIKLEAISRSGQQYRFAAAAFGVEYSFYDIASTGMDLGIVAEYLFDERDEGFNAVATDNDITLGLRFTLNDIDSTELLMAMGQDADNQSRFWFVEGSRRIGNNYKLSIEARGVSDVAAGDPLNASIDDDYMQIEFGYYY